MSCLVALVVCTILSWFVSAKTNLCYRLSYNYDAETTTYGQTTLLRPITYFPPNHAKVLHGVCGGATAYSQIPAGTSTCTDCKWSTSGVQTFSSCSSSTVCLGQCTQPCTPYSGCNGNGYANGGSLFYAYNSPISSSSNIGLENAGASTVFFVQDAADGVWLVLSYNTGAGGGVAGTSLLTIDATNLTETYVVQMDDVATLSTNPTACLNAASDCYGWNPATGQGSFFHVWANSKTDGMVLGPIPAASFSVVLKFVSSTGLSSIKFSSFENFTQEVTTTTMTDAQAGLRVEGFECSAYCSAFATCGECSVDNACSWCPTTSTCISKDDSVAVADCTAILNDQCCTGCEVHSTCDECRSHESTEGCAWCEDSGSCISGSASTPCQTCASYLFGKPCSASPTPSVSTTASVSATTSTTSSVSATSSTTASVSATSSTTSSVSATSSTTASVSATPSTTASVSATPSTTTSVSATPSTTSSVSATSSTTSSVSATASVSASSTLSMTTSSSASPSPTPSASTIHCPEVAALNLLQTIDTDPEVGTVTTQIWFRRPSDEGLMEGYMLKLVQAGQEEQQLITLASMTTAQLGGAPNFMVTAPFQVHHARATGTDSFLVVPYHARGECPSNSSLAVRDYSPPNSVAESLSQSADLDTDKGYVTSVLTFTRPLTESSSSYHGTTHYSLFIGDNRGTREKLIETKAVADLGGAPGQKVDNGFDLRNLKLNNATKFIVVARNDAFESTQQANEDIIDDGLETAVAATTTAVGVGAVAAVFVSSSMSGASSGGSASSASSSGTGSVDPMVMLGNMQGISMTGKIQIDTMPTSYRSFAQSMSFANGNTGVLGAMTGSSFGDSSSDATSGSSKSLKGLVKYATEVYVVSDGRPPEQYFWETLFFFAVIFMLVVFLVACQRVYYRSHQARTPEMKRKMRDYERAAITVVVASYYALVTTCVFVLWLENQPAGLVTVAVIVVCVLGAPLPFVAWALFYNHKKLVAEFASLNESDERRKELKRKIDKSNSLYSPLIGDEEHGWYSVLTLFRRCAMAIATVCLMQFGYWQCWVILVIYMICFVGNVMYVPFEGGRQSLSFKVETSGQVLQMATCVVPIVYYHTTGEPNDVAGLVVMACQMTAIIIVLCVTLAPMISKFFRRICSCCKSKPEEPDVDEKVAKPRELSTSSANGDTPPPVFYRAVARRVTSTRLSKPIAIPKGGIHQAVLVPSPDLRPKITQVDGIDELVL